MESKKYVSKNVPVCEISRPRRAADGAADVSPTTGAHVYNDIYSYCLQTIVLYVRVSEIEKVNIFRTCGRLESRNRERRKKSPSKRVVPILCAEACVVHV